MPEHPNIETIRRGYELFNKGDMDALAELLADDVTWHVPGRSSIAGDYQGRDATMAYFGRLHELTGGSYQADLHVVVGNDEYAVSIDHSSATRGETGYEGDEVLVFRLADGRIVEAWQALLSPYAHDEFFA